MDIRIYVGNLAKSTTQEEIQALFAQEGEVTSVDLVKDRDSGLSKGFAFVTMTSQETADKAIAKLNGYTLAGNQLKVKRRQTPGGTRKARLETKVRKKPRRTARFLFNPLLGEEDTSRYRTPPSPFPRREIGIAS